MCVDFNISDCLTPILGRLLTQRDASIKENRRSKWQEEKVLRVWTPPGYEKDNAPEGGWPVLYLNDGQVRSWNRHTP